MIPTVIIERHSNSLQALEKTIAQHCPELVIKGIANQKQSSIELIRRQRPQLVFAEIDATDKLGFEILRNFPNRDFETIFIANQCEQAVEAIQYYPTGYITKPLQTPALVQAIARAQKQIEAKQKRERVPDWANELMTQHKEQSAIIGVPTIEGFELLPVAEIVRCEGYQRCTRVVTIHKTDIISSYNIGKFRELLENFAFFSAHKSHVINLSFVRRYKKEGTIIMKDGAPIPVARRKRSDFLNQLTHL
ncbi:MAG: LytTR family DNA-binding domain-containing protein [Bacteroidota bacterium]